ncbi:conserved hypothetical protein [uncultured Pleomorphomonas sp.]|uniref:Uncharacterized protein n=1 Tax=uncultured Pleomorphomonas sp. TaxID=442121 RepID=A0A212LQM0_9HYPH|nr:hypothetical protein [uncultured Pleomorphomonas sp.]SCM79895.1 conserved hypothetical protein [uncultured Pleomorphomonas sp.]
MQIRPLLLFVAIIELIAALILHRMGLAYVELIIGAAITFILAELMRPTR